MLAGSGAVESGSTPADEIDSSFDGSGNLLSTTRNGMQLATYTYNNDDGMLINTTDAAGNITTYSYSGCNGALPTQTTTPSHLSVHGEYDSNCMVLTSFTDANDQTTSYTYDGLGRIRTVAYPDDGSVSFIYDDASRTVTENQVIDDSRSSTLEVQFDGLGREIRRATKLGVSSWLNGVIDSSGDAWRESDLVYDNRGRKGFVSYPYLTTSPLEISSTTGDAYVYDALSRVTSVIHSDSSAVNSYYTARAVRVVDENGHARVSQSDALGRLLSVCEITPATMENLAPAACGQDDNQIGFITNYSYDILDDLTGVTQGAQTRSFSYADVLYRLSATTNPESGTINYTYSTPGNLCSGDPSQPCSKTDARGKTTHYAYDNEHHLISKFYSDDTPVACYQYGIVDDPAKNTGGRLINGWTQSGSCATQGTYTNSTQPTLVAISDSSNTITLDAVIFYDQMGRLRQASQQNKYGLYHTHTMSYLYNKSGGLIDVTDNLSTPLESAYDYDLAGELTSMSVSLNSGSSTSLFLNPVYAAGGLHNATLGAGLSLSRSYDERNRLISENDIGSIYTPAATASASLIITGSEQNVGKSTSSNGTITVSGAEQKGSLPTGATGTLIISGSENSTQVQTASATSSTGSIVISGSLQSKQVNHAATSGSTTIGISSNSSYLSLYANQCPSNPYATCYATIPNSGDVTVTINGTAYSVAYVGTSSTVSTVASSLASSINAGSLATATASGSVVTVTAKTTGTATNYSVSTTCSYNSSYFSQCGFTATGGAFTGGAATYTTASYDSGTATATIGGASYAYSYSGSSTTASTISSGLASLINAGSLASASASGATISLTAKSTGTAVNYAVSSSISYDSSVTSSASFTATATSMTGGKNATYTTVYNPGIVSLSVNGVTASYTYGQNDTSSTIASGLAAVIGAGCGAYPVTASVSSNILALASCNKGASVNYALTASAATTDTTNFTGSPFSVTLSGSTMTGGTASGGATVYDSGTAAVTINGQSFDYEWSGSAMTASTIASNLASSINASSNYVSATVSGAVITLVSKTAAALTNYSYSASTSYNSTCFGASSFALATAASAMTGGTTNGVTVYDNGSVAMTINGVTQTVSYAQGDTTATVASKLASAFSSNSNVNVTASGSTLVLRAKSAGAAGNYNYSLTSETDNGDYFSSPSFTASAASGVLSGGADAYTTGNQTVYSYGVSYASNSNVTGMSDSVMGSWSYVYDDFNRISSATAADGVRALTWDYDRYGNGSQTGTLSNSLTYARGNNQIDGVIYDASGNVLSYNDATKGAMSYTYDAESRVASVSVGGTLAAKYVYDASGARVAKLTSTDSVTANYVLGPGGVYAELDASDNIVHRDLYAGSALAASYDRSGALHLHLSDWLGTRRAQTDAAGVLQMTYASYPFGDGLASTAAAGYSGDDSNEKHFTGKERDSESGLDYFGARYMASNMGRFMSPDWSAKAEPVPYAKLDNPQSLNLYAYVGNNPLRNVDKDGHCDSSANATANTKCQDVSNLHVNDAMKQKIKQSEGLPGTKGDPALKVYKDGAGHLTVGWGHKVTAADGLKLGDTIKTDQAQKFFDSDLSSKESAVANVLTRNGGHQFSQGEFNALVDLAYNAGSGALTTRKSPSLMEDMKAGDYTGMSGQLRYTKDSAGNVEPGLVRRSDDRKAIFLGADPDSQ